MTIKWNMLASATLLATVGYVNAQAGSFLTGTVQKGSVTEGGECAKVIIDGVLIGFPPNSAAKQALLLRSTDFPGGQVNYILSGMISCNSDTQLLPALSWVQSTK